MPKIPLFQPPFLLRKKSEISDDGHKLGDGSRDSIVGRVELAGDTHADKNARIRHIVTRIC